MVYKKYVYKRGKRHGPYYYHSYREGDSVKKVYIGGKEEYKAWLKKQNSSHYNKERRTTNKFNFSFLKTNNFTYIAVALIFLLAVFMLVFFYAPITGKVSLDIQDSYIAGENLSGILRLGLKRGELLPIDSKIIIEQQGSVAEYSLGRFVSSNSNGTFYVENVELEGKGVGYGFAGEKISYPSVFFKLKVYEGGEVGGGVSAEENKTEIQEPENKTEAIEETKENETIQETETTETAEPAAVEPTETPSETTTENLPAENIPTESTESENTQETPETSLLTGAVVEENEQMVEGSCKKEEPFIYNLKDGQTAQIAKNSVEVELTDENGKVKKEKIDENEISLAISEGKAEVSTEYSLIESGFGKEYLSQEEEFIEINLESLGIKAEDGTLKISLVYENTTINELSKNINVVQPELAENLTLNETNLTEFNQTGINITTKHYMAVIGQPVKWVKLVEVENPGSIQDLKLELPKEAKNITIKTGAEARASLKDLEIEELEYRKGAAGKLTGEVSLELEEKEKKGLLTRLWEMLFSPSITARVIEEQDIQNEIVETSDSKILDVTNIVKEAKEEVAIEYETPAPQSEEQEIQRGKRVTISAADELGYQDVLAYSSLDNKIPINNKERIKLYWIRETNETIENNQDNETLNVVQPELAENIIFNETNFTETNISEAVEINETNESYTSPLTGSAIEEEIVTTNPINNPQQIITKKIIREEVEFDAYDLDNDGRIDYIEWIVPHLSNQTYEIIYITKAEHLDENYTFIQDVYEQVKEQDNNYTLIPGGDYLRVTFEQALDNTKDITIYARAVNETGCYDNETQILTENGWKYFYDLSESEMTMTLNPETREKEWQIPYKKQEFENDGKMYKIELADGSRLLVSEKHKVYSSSEIIEINSLVLNTFILSCLFNNFSSDHKIQLNFEANAKYGASLVCSGNISQAPRINSLNSSSGMNFILLPNMESNLLNSSEVLCVFDKTSSLLLENSINKSSGAISCSLLETNISSESSVPLISNENNSFASTTTIIYLPPLSPNFSARDLLTFFPNLNASSCVISDLDLNSLKNSKSAIFCMNASLATSDQFIILNDSILRLSSSGTDTVILDILNSSLYPNKDTQITQNTLIFKPFALQPVTETYEEINNGKEIYFLDSKNKPVKVKSIIKENYTGKIYDVDVENDIVLVRRGNGSAIWSGNSNPNQSAAVGVYRQDSNKTIAAFENITTDENGTFKEYKIYLTNLSENESYETFDLRSIRDIEYDYVVDPNYSFDSTVEDVSVAPLDTDKYVVGWCDETQDDMTFAVYYLNGTNILAATDVDTDIGQCSGPDQVAVTALNTTTFVIAWYEDDTLEGTYNNLSLKVYDTTGNNLTNTISVYASVGSRFSASLAPFNSTNFVIAFFEKNDQDVYYKIYDNKGTLIRTGYSNTANVGLTVNCAVATFNETGFVVTWADSVSEDTHFRIHDFWGGNITSVTDADAYAGWDNGIAVATLNSSNFVIAWQDRDTNDDGIADTPPNLTIRSYLSNGTPLSNSIIITDNWVTDLSASSVNSTDFVIGWEYADPKFKRFYWNGSNLTDWIDMGTSTSWISVASRLAANSLEFCNDNIMAVWPRNTTLFMGEVYYPNGSVSLGSCFSPLLTACGTLSQPNTVYNLTTNLQSSDTCFTIAADNITLDGRGYNINGSDIWYKHGVYAEGRTNITVKNLNVSNFYAGVFYDDGTNNSIIFNNTVYSSNYSSIYLNTWSVNNQIINNTLSSDVVAGVMMSANASHNQITNNRITKETYGIYLANSINNTVKDNTFNFSYVCAIVILESDNATIINNTLTNSGTGTWVLTSNGSKFINNTLTNSSNAIYVSYNSSHSQITGNRIINTSFYGIAVLDGRNTTIKDNNINGSEYSGIFLSSSENDTVTNNTIRESGYGLYLLDANGSEFANNTIEHSENIGIQIDYSTMNQFVGGSVNGSRSTAILILGTTSRYNNFTNISVENTNTSVYDFVIYNGSTNGTYLIDMPNIDKYRFNESGGGCIVNFKDSAYGMIEFLQGINGSGENNLTADIQIRNNSVMVNSSANLGLNKSANITLYGNPSQGMTVSLLRDNQVCPASICYNFTSLKAATVKFNVSYWTNYSLQDIVIPDIKFKVPTPNNDTLTMNTSIPINISISEINLNEVKWNWNGTNYTLFNDSVLLLINMDNNTNVGDSPTNVADASRRGNNGTWVGGQDADSGWNCTTSKYGCAIMFDGAGDFINLTSGDFYQNTRISIAMWVRFNNLSGLNNLFISGYSGSDPWIHSTVNRTGVTTYFGTSYTHTPYTFSEKTWYHIAFTTGANGATGIVYVNGASAGTFSIAAGTGVEASFGRTRSGWAHTGEFNGTADELMFINRTLSADEVYQLYVSNLQKFNSTLWYLYVNQSQNSTTGLANGTYTYYAYVKDGAGSGNMTESRDITIGSDTTAPKILVRSPTNTTYPTSTVTFNVSSNENLSFCKFTINDWTYNYTMTRYNDTYFNFTNSSMKDGSFIARFWCNDTANNVNNTETTAFAVDATLPDARFKPPTPNNDTTTANTSIEFNVSIVGPRSSEVKWNWNTTNYTLLNDSVVLMYNFENLSALGENASKIVDLSKYSNNGTFSVSADADSGWTSSGKYGGAWMFDGDGDYIEENVQLVSGYPFTMSIWIKTETNESSSLFTIANKTHTNIHYGLSISNNGNISIFGRNTGMIILSSDVVANNTGWHHVVGVFNENTDKRLYVDGIYKVNLTNSITYSTTIDRWSIGRTGDSTPGGYFNGSIDEAIFYNRSLSADEIYQLYVSNLQKFNMTLWYLYVNQSRNSTTGLGDGTYTYSASAKDAFGNENRTDLRSITIQSNSAPVASTPQLSPAYPNTDNDINCSYTVTDSNAGDTLTANITWYNNTKTHIRIATSAKTGVSNSTVLKAGNTSIGESWICGVTPYDGTVWGVEKNSSGAVVVKTPFINFVAPTPDNDTTTANTSIEFNASIIEEVLEEVKWNWNGTNYTLFNDSVILMYNFENLSALGENASKIVDLSQYSNNGTFSVSADADSGYTASGKYGGAWMFDGDGDHINITDSNSLDATTGSIALWFKLATTTFGSDFGLVNKKTYGNWNDPNGWDFYIQNDPTSFELVSSGSDFARSATQTFDTNWHFAVVTFSGTTAHIYYDSILIDSDTSIDAVAVNNNNTFIGSRATGSYFNGSIDNVIIYNRSLSADEIYQLYISNLQKFNMTLWYLYVNQSQNATTGLADGTYTYSASAKDAFGNENRTDLRSISITDWIDVSLCQDLSSANTGYRLTQDVSRSVTCMNVTANNVTLDCQGHKIVYGSGAGTGVYGVYVAGYNYPKIKNCIINQSVTTGTTQHGIYFYNASKGLIQNNTIRTIDSGTYGIVLTTNSTNNSIIGNNVTSSGATADLIYLTTNSNSNEIAGNTIKAASSGNGIYMTTSKLNDIVNNTEEVATGYGIYFYDRANESTIRNNTITSSTSGYGIWLSSAMYNNLTGNWVNTTQAVGYMVSGTSSQHYNHTIGKDNYAEGKPVNYTYDLENKVFNNVKFTDYGQVIFGWSRNITVTNSNFSDDCLNLFSTNTSTISYNKMVTTKGYGIFLYLNSHENNLTFNNITTYGTNNHGIFSYYSNVSEISNNNISTSGDATAYGIYLSTASNYSIANNTILTNGTNTGYGIYLYNRAKDNLISGNNITTRGAATGYGIYVYTDENYNTITGNTITTSGAATGYGMYLYSTANDNTVSNNIIITNGTATGYGIVLSTNSKRNVLINNTITTKGAGSGYGILLSAAADDNRFFNNTIIGRGIATGHGIYFSTNTTNNTFSGMNVITNGTTSYALYFNDINASFEMSDSILNSTLVPEVHFIKFGKPGEINLTNVTQENGSVVSINWTSGSNVTLNMYWYLDVNVSDNSTSESLENANVTGWNKDGTYLFSELTGANGRTRQTLLEYRNENNTLKTYYTPHTVNTSLTGYRTNSSIVNLSLTWNTWLDVELGFNGTLSACGILSKENATYTLNQSITSTGTCFSVLANNVTLDCQAYEINYSSDGSVAGYGVNVSNHNYATIKNCTILEGVATTNSKHAVYFNNASNGLIANNNITTFGTSSQGIDFSTNSNLSILKSNTITTYGSFGIAIALYVSSNSNNVTDNTITTNGTFSYGIYSDTCSFNNFTNNRISTNGSSTYGIYLYSTSNYNAVRDNAILINGSNGEGIMLHQSSNNNLRSNTVTAYGNSSYGIDLNLISRSNNLTNNTVTAYGNYSRGFYVYAGSEHNTLLDNTITITGGQGHGIYLQDASNNNSFSRMNIKTNNTNGYAIYIYDKNPNFTITDSLLNSSLVPEVYVRNAVTDGEWNFTNVTKADGGTPITINWTAGGNGTLNMYWYLDVNVSDSGTNALLENANVTTWDAAETYKFSELTNSSGNIARKTLLEYRNENNTLKTYYTQHIINTSLVDYTTNSTTVNFSSTLNKWLNIKLTGTARPTNVWNCSAAKLFTDTGCWTLKRVPIANDKVVFNGTGTGECNITNNTMPQDLNSFTVESGYTGKIYFAPLFAAGAWGDWKGTQEWNVTNNINISGGTMYIYGDGYNVTTETWMVNPGMHNLTDDAHGQEWRSVSGNIIVGSSGNLNGIGLGFKVGFGPGYTASIGGSYGGKGGGNSKNPYGNFSAPTSLGSGGSSTAGGSGIKLHANSLIQINGAVDMKGGSSTSSSTRGGAGGSIWLKANNISGTGILNASGGNVGTSGTSRAGGGGRIRLEYGNSLELSGTISVDSGSGEVVGKPGTLTFTNNTWQGNWNLTANTGLLGGNFGDGEVINVLGNFNTNNYNMTVYGDCFYSVSSNSTCYNSTADGRGVWINASGNITVSASSTLDGDALGFPATKGPGYASYAGSYGGRGLSGGAPYGNETQPRSLGSGGANTAGGSGIKLQTNTEYINLLGSIYMRSAYSSGGRSGSGGSIWLDGKNIIGTGLLNTTGGTGDNGGGGGGRIALTSVDKIEFSGTIENRGGLATAYTNDGSGGTVYINATTSIISSMNISVVGYNGSAGASDWGQKINITGNLITLSGVYNASALNTSLASTRNGTITINYTDCSSDFEDAIFDPKAVIYLTQCTPNATIVSPPNQTVTGNATINFTANVSSPSGIRNITLWLYNQTGLYNSTTWTYTQGVFRTIVGIPVVMIEGVYNWFFEVYDWANNFVSTEVTEGNMTLIVDLTYPLINFTNPTPSNASTQAATAIYVNVTTNGSAGVGTNISTFIDFDNSLVGWWRMDDINSSGDVVDYTGRNNGTAYGDATQTDAGKLGKAFEFDGNKDYINITDSASLRLNSSAGTIGLWIYSKELTTGATFFTLFSKNAWQSDRNGYTCYFQTGSGGLRCYTCNATASSYSTATTTEADFKDKWKHVVFTWNQTQQRLYVDGVQEDLDNVIQGMDSTGYSLRIGMPADVIASNYDFNGTIDDVIIFNRSLSAEEVRALYANQSSRHTGINFTGQADGSHTFKAYVQDYGGNVNYTELRTVTITTNAAPTMKTVDILPDSPSSSEHLRGYCNASDVDDDAEIQKFEYIWYNNSVQWVNGTAFKEGSISLGAYHTCGIRANDSRVLCWGFGNEGQLGDNNSAVHYVPTPNLTVDSSAYLSVEAGASHTCGIRANDSRVLCWGEGDYGALGDGDTSSHEVGVPNLTEDSSAYLSISGGGYHTCGIRANDSRVLCWGYGSNGQLGDGDTASHEVGVPNLTEDSSAYLSVEAGGSATCGIRANDSRVLCWGWGEYGRLADGDHDSHNVAIPNLTQDSSAYLSISGGGSYNCGIRANDSRVLCWGYGSDGILGDGDTASHEVAIPNLTKDESAYLSVAAKNAHTCGIRANDSRVLCWGQGAYGALGDGDATGHDVAIPNLTEDSSAYLSIFVTGSMGSAHTCGLRANDSRVLCWGQGAYGALGDGSNESHNVSSPNLTQDSSAYSSFFANNISHYVSLIDEQFTKQYDNWTFTCRAYDGTSYSDWMNDTESVGTLTPSIYLEYPANNTKNTTSRSPSFVFNVSDNRQMLDCTLWLRNSTFSNISYGRNATTLNATSTTITANDSLANGDYWWWINCSDGDNTNVSQERNISIIPSWTDISACRDLDTANTEYRLTQDVSRSVTCMNITANNVTLDCQGHKIVYGSGGGTGVYGVYSNMYNYPTIKNCIINQSVITGTTQHGIYFYNASKGLIQNNTIRTIDSGTYGIVLTTNATNNSVIGNNLTSSGTTADLIYLTTNSNLNVISDNTVKAASSGNGIYMTTSKLNDIVNNTVEVTSGYGIYFYDRGNESTVRNNTVTSSTSGYGIALSSTVYNNLTGNWVNTTQLASYLVLGTSSQHYNHTIGKDNYAEGKPVNYTYNIENKVFNNVDFTDYGQVIFGWSRNITVTNSNFSDDCLGLFYTNTSTISYNKMVTTKGFGIFLYLNSHENNLTFNNITTYGTYGHGIFSYYSNVSEISNNNISTSGAATAYGIYLNTASNYSIMNNTILTNGTNTGYGIYLYNRAKYNTISGNNITTRGAATGYGIYLDTNEDYNTITGNTMTTSGAATGYGMYLYSSASDNTVSSNVIITNGTASGYGIYLSTSSKRNNIINNTITTKGAGTGAGILLAAAADDNRFFNNTVIGRGTATGYGIYFSTNSTNNTFSGMNVKTNGTTSYALYFNDVNSSFEMSDSILNSTLVPEIYFNKFGKPGEINLTNVTLENGSAVRTNWTSGANLTLSIYWYLDVNVSDSSTFALLENANVTAWDAAETYKFSELTNASGNIARKTLLESTRTNTSAGSTSTTFYTAHTINTTLAGYAANSTTVNFSSTLNKWLNILLSSENDAPVVTLISPANGNITTDRTPNFTWSGSDGDGPDALQYEINITCWQAGSIVTAGSEYVAKETLGSATSYTPTDYLKCLSDNGQNYNWTVRAWDGVNWSAWATERNLSVQSLIETSMLVNFVNLGELNISDQENTSDNNPAPLVLSNDGNSEINVSINFTDIFSTESNPSAFYKYVIRNTSAGCFVTSQTQTTWANSPAITTHAINRMNFTSGYQSGCSNTSIDVHVEVPSDEPPGNKTSTVTLTSSLGEPKTA